MIETKDIKGEFFYRRMGVPKHTFTEIENNFKVAFDPKQPFLKRVKRFFAGENKAGRTVGSIVDFLTVFLPYSGKVNTARKAAAAVIGKKRSYQHSKTGQSMDFLFNRLKEKSTWRGITAALTAFGVALSPDQTAAIVTAGVAIAGVFEMFFKEPQSKDAK